MNLFESEEYQAQRKSRMQYFVPENFESNETYSALFGETSDNNSIILGDRYVVVVETYRTKPGYGKYTKITVTDSDTDTEMSIHRNSSPVNFIFTEWKGKKYFICGEDYQGITVLNLTSKTENTFIPYEWKTGCGWCITEFLWCCEDINSGMVTLAAEGCVWGCDITRRTFTIKDLDDISLDDFTEERDEEEDEDDE